MTLVIKNLQADAQISLLSEIATVIEQAPLHRPTLPRWGTPFSVEMTNCGVLGWVSDKSGYRYQTMHPVTHKPWPKIPKSLLDLWTQVTDYPKLPEACLINYYATTAKMGLHQDKDEEDFDAPVMSISLGDDARFLLGGASRKDKPQKTTLKSGDIMLLEQENRLAFHGIDKIYPQSADILRQSGLFPAGGRLNITLRRVTK